MRMGLSMLAFLVGVYVFTWAVTTPLRVLTWGPSYWASGPDVSKRASPTPLRVGEEVYLKNGRRMTVEMIDWHGVTCFWIDGESGGIFTPGREFKLVRVRVPITSLERPLILGPPLEQYPPIAVMETHFVE